MKTYKVITKFYGFVFYLSVNIFKTKEEALTRIKEYDHASNEPGGAYLKEFKHSIVCQECEEGEG